MKSFSTPERRKALADIFRSLPIVPNADAILNASSSVIPAKAGIQGALVDVGGTKVIPISRPVIPMRVGIQADRTDAGRSDAKLSAARELRFAREANLRVSTSRAIRFTTMAAVLLGAIATANAADGQTARQSWTSDSRAFAEGDAITVLIDEYTLAAANRGNFASDRRFRDLELGADQSVTSSIPGVAAAVSSGNQNESRQRDEATRQNRFQGEMTVRVVGIEPGGMLRVEGTKTLNIDGAVEELRLSGLIRAQDVGDLNMVDSWRVSDTEIVYSTRGNGPKGGILGRILGMLWP